MRCDVAVGARSGRDVAHARPGADDHPIDDERTRAVIAPGRGLPLQLSGPCVQTDHVPIRGGVENQVLIERQRFGALPAGLLRGKIAGVLPHHIAVCCVECLDSSARHGEIHHPVVDQWHGFRDPRAEAARPRQAEPVDVLRGDLIERAEALGVVRAAEHQPVVRTGLLQHLLRDRIERLDLGERRADGRCDRAHEHQDQRHPERHVSSSRAAWATPGSTAP